MNSHKFLNIINLGVEMVVIASFFLISKNIFYRHFCGCSALPQLSTTNMRNNQPGVLPSTKSYILYFLFSTFSICSFVYACACVSCMYVCTHV